MILKHYLIRTAKDPLNFIMLILFPLVMVAIFITTGRQGIPFELREYNGFCLQASGMLAFNVLFFQYFCGMIVTDYLYLDFRSDMRWRLMSTPKSFGTFVINAIVASIIISAINGAIVLTVARFVFNAYFNIPMTILALFGLSTFVTLFGVLCYMIFPKKGTTTAVIMVFAFSQMLALNFGLINMSPFGEVGVDSFLPMGAATAVMNYTSGMWAQLNYPELGWEGGFTTFGTDMNMALTHLGILGGLVVVTLVAVLILGRKNKI